MNWLLILPYAFQVIAWLLGKYNASVETKKAFLNLVEQAKLDPAISLKLKDDFDSMEAELKQGGGF